MPDNALIGICDDHKEACISLRQIVTDICKGQDLSCEILLFQDGVSLLENKTPFQIVFLDIEMPGVDGIEVGRELQRIHPSCRIIMATSHEERFKEVIKIKAFRFVSKPFCPDEIKEALIAAFKEMPGQSCVEVFYDRVPCRIQQSQVIFVRAISGYVEINTRDRVYRKDIGILEMKMQLDDALFFQTHRSYIVNLSAVEKIKTGGVMIGTHSIPLARRSITAFKKALIKYETEYR